MAPSPLPRRNVRRAQTHNLLLPWANGVEFTYRAGPRPDGASFNGFGGALVAGNDGASFNGLGGALVAGNDGASFNGLGGALVAGNDGASFSGLGGALVVGHDGASFTGLGGALVAGNDGASFSGLGGALVVGHDGASFNGLGGGFSPAVSASCRINRSCSFLVSSFDGSLCPMIFSSLLTNRYTRFRPRSFPRKRESTLQVSERARKGHPLDPRFRGDDDDGGPS